MNSLKFKPANLAANLPANLYVGFFVLLALNACASQPYQSENDPTTTTSNLLNQPAENQQTDTNMKPAAADTAPGVENVAKKPKELTKQADGIGDTLIDTGVKFSEAGDTRNLEEKTDGDFYVTVGPEDTISDIAEKFTGKVGNWQELARLNHLGSRGIVKVGQKIRIPNFMKEISIATAEETDSSLPIAKTVPLK